MDKIKLNSSPGFLLLTSDILDLDGFKLQIDFGYYYVMIDKIGDVTTIQLNKLNRYGQTNTE